MNWMHLAIIRTLVQLYCYFCLVLAVLCWLKHLVHIGQSHLKVSLIKLHVMQ
jgi:hypothetical protein